MNDTKPKDAVILAGGKGTRLKTTDYSKPMIPVCGKPVITYTIDSLLDSGFDNINVIYHKSTSDVLKLRENKDYSKALNFIEDKEQKGGMVGFSYVKEYVEEPFIMSFADIIVRKDHFKEMLLRGLKVKNADLLIQTVEKSSIPFEKNLLLKNNRIIKWEKRGIVISSQSEYKVKSGGMVYLWNKNPFHLIEKLLSEGNYSFSALMKEIIQNNKVFEMQIKDIWDIDTVEDVAQTEKILSK
jgi:NDP-sugar pyrophosphorylase family protein